MTTATRRDVLAGAAIGAGALIGAQRTIADEVQPSRKPQRRRDRPGASENLLRERQIPTWSTRLPPIMTPRRTSALPSRDSASVKEGGGWTRQSPKEELERVAQSIAFVERSTACRAVFAASPRAGRALRSGRSRSRSLAPRRGRRRRTQSRARESVARRSNGCASRFASLATEGNSSRARMKQSCASDVNMFDGKALSLAGAELSASAETILAVTSSCTAKMSVKSRSYRSAHRCPPVVASMSCAVILTLAPDFRTLP